MLCKKCGCDIPQESSGYSEKIGKGIGSFALWGVKKTISTTLSIPLRLASSLTQMIVKPVLYGGFALALVHVTVQPDESRKIGLKLLKKSPDAMRTVVSYTPTVCKILQRIGTTLYQMSLKALSKKICDQPLEQPTLLEVAKSLGRKLYSNATSQNHTQLVLLFKEQKKIQQGLILVEEKIKTANVLPRLIDFFTTKKST